jgi:uncharacterized membrane protein
MFDLPLHPIFIHLPLSLGILIPLLVAGLSLTISRGKMPLGSWALVIVLSLGHLAAAKLAEETGETDEELVERVVPYTAMEAHENVGKIIPVVALVIFLASVPSLFFRKSS